MVLDVLEPVLRRKFVDTKYHYDYYYFQCSVTCGIGVATREVRCNLGADSACASIPRPPERETCVVHPCEDNDIPDSRYGDVYGDVSSYGDRGSSFGDRRSSYVLQESEYFLWRHSSWSVVSEWQVSIIG